jgi:protein associated with RNAse G/E
LTELFAPGSTAVRRDVLNGKIWTATPNRVVADTGDTVVLSCWPGVEMMAPTTWIHWLLTDDDDVRKQAIPNLAAGQWDIDRWTWRGTTLVSRFGAGDWFSVHRYIAPDGGPTAWYVNFERPFRRTLIGIDTFDFLVDLVVAPDLASYRWKDEDEYAHARRIGLIDDALHAQIDIARDEVVALVEARKGPFAEDWSTWRPEPDWPLPTLPADALSPLRP